MAYIGYNPSQLAIAPFATKYFTGDGATTTFTLDQSVPGANEANVEVFVENVQQNPVDAYTIGGALNNQLIFSEAPVTGGAIYVIHKGEATYNLQPATGSVTANTLDPVLRNFTVDKFTGNGSTKTFTLTDTPYSPNSVLVVVDGITQTSGTNYNVTGNTLTFDVAPTASPDNGSNVTVVHLGFSSGNKAVMDASITPVKLSTGGPAWTTGGFFGINGGASGTASVALEVFNASAIPIRLDRISTAPVSQQAVYIGVSQSTLTGINGDLVLIPRTNTVGSLVVMTGNGTAVERLRVTSGGLVGIGTLSSAATNYPLHIKHNSGNQLALIRDLDYQSVGAMGTIISFGGRNGATEVVGAQVVGVMNTPTDGWLDINVLQSGAQAKVATFRGTTGALELPYGQIKFPVAQNASSDPNTLDDYEEGTFTPSYSSSGISAVVYGTGRNGYYTKVGRLVTVNINIMTNSVTVTNSSADVTISGLPFAQANDTECSSSGAIGSAVRWSVNPPRTCMISPGSSNVRLFSTAITTAEDETLLRVSDMVPSGSGNRNSCRLTITYYV